MLRTVSGIGTVRAKSVFAKEKNARQARWRSYPRGNEPPIRSPKAGGSNPYLGVGSFEIAGYLSKTACGSIGLLCQLGHIREKCLRLADEKTHSC